MTPLRRFSRRSGVPVLALFLSGCFAIPLPVRGLRNTEPSPTLDRKLVVGKEAPVYLIAEDGTQCLATERRFQQTRIGSHVWCVWIGTPGTAYR